MCVRMVIYTQKQRKYQRIGSNSTMFATLLVFAVALSSGSCKTFVVGVRLLLPESLSSPAPACDFLRSRAPARWKEGAFSHCVSKHAGETADRNFAIPYSITVDPAKIAASPLDGTYASKVAFVNKQLNLNRSDCLTVVGSHWGRPLQDSDMKLRMQLYMKTSAKELTPVTCNKIEEWLHDVGQGLQSHSCFLEQLPLVDQTLYQHRFILHVKVPTENVHILPTQHLINATLHTVSSEKAPQPNCIHVAHARYNPTINSWSFELHARLQNTRVSACQFLISLIGYRNVTCYKTVVINRQPNDTKQIVKLNIGADELGWSANNMDITEAALRVHYLVNDAIVSCVVANVDQLKEAFKPVPYKGYYSAVISGPVEKHFCKMEKIRSPYTVHSCVVIRRPLEEGGSGVYRFRPKEPFYALDLPWFMNKHHERVKQLNSKNGHCDFNGFIQLNTDDPIEEKAR